MALSRFIQQNYVTAAAMAKDNNELDEQMLSSVKQGAYDAQLVKRWMTSYQLFQGFNARQRSKISHAYTEVAPWLPRFTNPPPEDKLTGAFLTVLEILDNAGHVGVNNKARKWLSAASKLLWCHYPHDIPMYDRFVFQAMTTLQGVEPALFHAERLGVLKPKNNRESADQFYKREAQHYLRYRRAILAVYASYSELLDDLRSKYNVAYPYDLRLLDKLLLILGNPSRDIQY